MKYVSIKELHERTGKCVREAAGAPIVITDHGRRIAVMKPYAEDEIPGSPFPTRDAAALPEVKVDSTGVIADDRDAR